MGERRAALALLAAAATTAAAAVTADDGTEEAGNAAVTLSVEFGLLAGLALLWSRRKS